MCSVSSENLLDVLNCNDSEKQVIEYEVYRCPARGKFYENHKKAKYFGVYHNKRVSHIAEIMAVVDVFFNDDGTTRRVLSYSNEEVTREDELKQLAVERLKLHGEANKENKVFLLKNLFETNFSNGLVPWQGHNRVFDVSQFRVSNSQELAAALDGELWSNVPKARK